MEAETSTGAMLILLVTLSCVAGVHSILPPSGVCYQERYIRSACDYGNLTVAVLGKTYKSKDCNARIDNQELQQAPIIYINSTNTTERFTVMMIDQGYQGHGGNFLQWMITNVSINTLPNYRFIPPNDVLAGYQQPLLMIDQPQPHLVQILVFRHHNVLRVPFGELWITKRQNFMLSNLYSNTQPNLQLCGPVAGIQFWVHDDHRPSAPLLPPGQIYPPPPYTSQTGGGGYIPPPGHSDFHHPSGNGKKNSAASLQPMSFLLVPLVIKAIMSL